MIFETTIYVTPIGFKIENKLDGKPNRLMYTTKVDTALEFHDKYTKTNQLIKDNGTNSINSHEQKD